MSSITRLLSFGGSRGAGLEVRHTLSFWRSTWLPEEGLSSIESEAEGPIEVTTTRNELRQSDTTKKFTHGTFFFTQTF
jgi:hypothetical protein